jgi:hypothetical protein
MSAMRRWLNGDAGRPLSEIVFSGPDFFAYCLYMVPPVQYRDGIEYLGRAVSVPGLRQPREIRFTVCLPVCFGGHTRFTAGTTTAGDHNDARNPRPRFPNHAQG